VKKVKFDQIKFFPNVRSRGDNTGYLLIGRFQPRLETTVLEDSNYKQESVEKTQC